MTKSTAKNLHFQMILRPEPEGGFTVFIPLLPGCVTYGKTLDQARSMAKEAVSLYLEDLIAEGEPIPDGDRAYIGQIEIPLPEKSRALAHA